MAKNTWGIWVLRLVVGLSAALFLAALIGREFITINYTTSFPLGVYLNTSKTPEQGDLVRFCPEPSPVFEMAKQRGYLMAGPCRGNYGFLIKKILAAKGDSVEFTAAGVFVNGDFIKNSLPQSHDHKGRDMPIVSGGYILGEDEVLLLSDYNPASFDARYFGLQPAARIDAALVPLRTW